MHLPPAGREYYRLAITTDPPVAPTVWSATFDEGATWHVAVDVDGAAGWLLAGPDATQGSAVAVIAADTRPMVRMTDNPEVVVRRAPAIYLDTP